MFRSRCWAGSSSGTTLGLPQTVTVIGLPQRVHFPVPGGVSLMLQLALALALWLLASSRAAPADASGAAIEYDLVGMLGKALAVVLEPIGFNRQIGTAQVPGTAARAVVVSPPARCWR